MTTAYAFPDRALLWIDLDHNRIAIDPFDLPRAPFDAACPDPNLGDRLIATRDGLPQTWVRTVSRTVQIDLHLYTEEPPQEPTP